MSEKIKKYLFIFDNDQGETKCMLSHNLGYLEFTRERMARNANKQIGNMRPIDIIEIEYTDPDINEVN